MNKEKKETAGGGAAPSTHEPVPRPSEIQILRDSASQELEHLLRTHPDLEKLQDEIERLLRNSGTFENRMAVLGLMIEAKLQELQNRISRLFSAD